MALSDILSAAADKDLVDRMAAAAAVLGVPSPRTWAEANAQLVACHKVGADTEIKIGDVYGYAVAQVKEKTVIPMAPGLDPQYVTDEQLIDAVRSVLNDNQQVRPDGNAY